MRCFIVDAFTDAAFKGNPAAVCLLESDVSDSRMRQIASEFNLSETAFIRPFGSRDRFSIRYFSPKMEIPLCGHATLAAAKVLFATTESREVRFRTTEDVELVARDSEGAVEMEFPVYGTRPSRVPDALLAALGLDAVENAEFNEETRILLLEIEGTRRLADLQPDFVALERSHESISGVLVTAASVDDEYDFHSRYFWPWSGTNEDPVTGGTHTFLAPYWSSRLDKICMKSFQSSSRSGSMEVELTEGKLLIRSPAVIVLEGRLILDR